MTPTVAAYLFLLEEAFEGRGIEASDESQALLPNLGTVSEAEWRTLPSGATRTIESMVLHVAGCKIMYADYAFGAGTKQWGTPEVEGHWQTCAAPMAEAIAWLRPTRWIVAAIIGHDFYHAGEINHLRSMLGTDDRWRWQQFDDPA